MSASREVILDRNDDSVGYLSVENEISACEGKSGADRDELVDVLSSDHFRSGGIGVVNRLERLSESCADVERRTRELGRGLGCFKYI